MRYLFLTALMTSLLAAIGPSAMPAPIAGKQPVVEVKTGFVEHKDYTLFVPHAYKDRRDDKTYPLILFLHGAGHANTPPEKVPGLGPHIRSMETKFPFFVIFPRGANNGFWFKESKPLDSKRALAILEEVQKEHKGIDAKRLYLTGVSMGGLGTWDLAEEKPGLWAAIVPVSAGQGNNKSANEPPQKKVAAIKELPCWCFHGLKDTTVKPHWTKDMVKAARESRRTSETDVPRQRRPRRLLANRLWLGRTVRLVAEAPQQVAV